ncbi:MAG: hypothetical protein GY833_22185 [Aestuariibacter sp.]|nr:hypothetical protein [Aestuariibacter sp.]|tara:strand:+ start:29730 stop:29987 length:258 start_codon:yes stop_codon:yes gene_type:complete
MTKVSQQELAFAANNQQCLESEVTLLRSAVKDLLSILDNIEMIPEAAPHSLELQRTLTEQELARRDSLDLRIDAQGQLLLYGVAT